MVLAGLLQAYLVFPSGLHLCVHFSKQRTLKREEGVRKNQLQKPLDSLGWNNTHSEAFDRLQGRIKQATRLAYRNPKMVLCLHTDASDRHWAAAAAHCSPGDLSKPLTDQSHQPLAFLSGTFSEREEHWSTYERKAFAVVQAFRKLDYLLAYDRSTRVFIDHQNLLSAFNPAAMKPSLRRRKVLKVVRWALYRIPLMYRIEHVQGDVKTWPDIMTRWMRGYRRAPAIERITLPLPFSGVTNLLGSPEFD